MNPPPMTLEQQKDYVRRLAEGWAAANADQLETVRGRTEAEQWEAAERVLGGRQAFTPEREARRRSSGLVEQQRYFRLLHSR